MDFAQEIRQRMFDLRISASALARKTGYSPQYMCDLLYKKSNRRRWNETTLTKVCNALDLEIRIVSKQGGESDAKM